MKTKTQKKDIVHTELVKTSFRRERKGSRIFGSQLQCNFAIISKHNMPKFGETEEEKGAEKNYGPCCNYSTWPLSHHKTCPIPIQQSMPKRQRERRKLRRINGSQFPPDRPSAYCDWPPTHNAAGKRNTFWKNN